MATVNGAYALGLEDELGAIGPGLRADLMLVKYAGGDAYESVLAATDEDILAAWIGGRTILLSRLMDERLSESDCVALDDMAPRVCGVLDAFGLTVDAFGEYVVGFGPDKRRQGAGRLRGGAGRCGALTEPVPRLRPRSRGAPAPDGKPRSPPVGRQRRGVQTSTRCGAESWTPHEPRWRPPVPGR